MGQLASKRLTRNVIALGLVNFRTVAYFPLWESTDQLSLRSLYLVFRSALSKTKQENKTSKKNDYSMCTKGIFTRKPLGHGSWKSLDFHWLRLSQAPTLGLHKSSFGPQPITSTVCKKIYLEFHLASMDNVGRNCRGGDWYYRMGFFPSKRLWTIVQGFLYGLIQKAGYHGHVRAMV